MIDLISVIVPVYNVEPYLRKCVDSILAQSYSNLEVILVDDGSPDGCGAICDEYAAKDARVRVIHKPNGGVSDARNAGLDIMTGEYVAFVDSDDWIDEQHLSSLYALVKGGADIAVSDVRRILTDETEICRFVYQQREDITDESIFGYAWNKLYRRSIIGDVRFTIPFIEDLTFNLRILGEKHPCYVFTKTASYNYLMREDSLLTSPVSHEKVQNFALFINEMLLTAPLYYNDEEKCRQYCSRFIGNQTCNLFCEISSYMPYSVSQKSSIMKDVLGVIPKGILRWKYADHTLLRLLVVVSRLRCPVLFHFAYRIILKIKEGANT